MHLRTVTRDPLKRTVKESERLQEQSGDVSATKRYPQEVEARTAATKRYPQEVKKGTAATNKYPQEVEGRVQARQSGYRDPLERAVEESEQLRKEHDSEYSLNRAVQEYVLQKLRRDSKAAQTFVQLRQQRKINKPSEQIPMDSEAQGVPDGTHSMDLSPSPSTIGHKSPASSREGSLADGEGKSGGLSGRGSTRSSHDTYTRLEWTLPDAPEAPKRKGLYDRPGTPYASPHPSDTSKRQARIDAWNAKYQVYANSDEN